MPPDLANLRTEYAGQPFSKADADRNPLTQFDLWFEQATKAGIIEANAMTLSTVSPDGRPSGRIVLLKGFDQRGFIFYTSYSSRKAQEIELNPMAAITLFWQPLARQIRVEGILEKLGPEESDAYFVTRPRASRMAARVSPQSQVIPNRKWLEDRFDKEKLNKHCTRPDNWGGYVLVPDTIEFWQGREGRMHDRLCYHRTIDGWKIDRLAP